MAAGRRSRHVWYKILVPGGLLFSMVMASLWLLGDQSAQPLFDSEPSGAGIGGEAEVPPVRSGLSASSSPAPLGRSASNLTPIPLTFDRASHRASALLTQLGSQVGLAQGTGPTPPQALAVASARRVSPGREACRVGTDSESSRACNLSAWCVLQNGCLQLNASVVPRRFEFPGGVVVFTAETEPFWVEWWTAAAAGQWEPETFRVLRTVLGTSSHPQAGSKVRSPPPRKLLT
jgi:hypothetical protein